MADPLSITTGVVALLGTCITVATAIKGFYDGTAIVDVKVKALLSDVESFTQVLRMMNDTLEDDKVKSSLQETGHIGNHWANLSKSIQDGQNTLEQLQNTLGRVNKSVGVLDGARKNLRLKGAMDEISMFQQQIRSYRDTIQLSLQTVILWNQVAFKESNDKILPNLDELHGSIRRIAFDINARMITLQTLVENNARNEQIQTLSNLRNCIQSAASVVSSASTTLGIDHSDKLSVTNGSEFGECFPSQPSETMLRWVSSNTVYEFEEDPTQAVAGQTSRKSTGKTVQRDSGLGDTDQSYHSDSDNELEAAKFQALLRQGKQKLNTEDFVAAERLFNNCLTRATSLPSLSSTFHISIPKIMELLVNTYMHQAKWSEAQSVLIKKIALRSRSIGGDNSEVLSDITTLVHALLNQQAYAEALLYARRAHKGYRRMGDSGIDGVETALGLLVKIAHEEGNVNEEEAYAAILSEFVEEQAKRMRNGPTESLDKGGQSWYTSAKGVADHSEADFNRDLTEALDAGMPVPKVKCKTTTVLALSKPSEVSSSKDLMSEDIQGFEKVDSKRQRQLLAENPTYGGFRAHLRSSSSTPILEQNSAPAYSFEQTDHHGNLGYLPPGVLSGRIYRYRFFWFGFEPFESNYFSTGYILGEKSETVRHNISWASYTGQGLLFFRKRENEEKICQGVINLSEASDVTLSARGDYHFSFSVSGDRHTFMAPPADFNVWVSTLQSRITEAKSLKDSVTSSEKYNSTYKKLASGGLETQGELRRQQARYYLKHSG